ncbi:MAG: tetratricopeptide repeat protein [Anaerolineales bacterium]|nr:tetratricopeptide repeat protein [Anaerolineales bacterium]
MTSPLFLRHILANLAFWREQMGELEDRAIAHLEEERHNLYKAIEAGLSFPASQGVTIQLIFDLFEFIELRRHFHDWIVVLNRALQTNPPDLVKCRLLNHLGFVHALLGNLPEAMAFHHQALALSQASDNRREEMNANFGQGHVHFYRMEFDQAESFARLALAQITTLGHAANEKLDQMKYASIYTLIGLAAHMRGDYATAETYQQMGLEIRRAFPTQELVAKILMNLAITYEQSQKMDQALACLSEAKTILKNKNNQLQYIDILQALGTLYFMLNRYKEAEATFTQVDTSLLRRTGNFVTLAHQANNLGNVYLKQNRLALAKQSLSEAIIYWRQLKEAIFLANTLGDLAETLVRLNEPAEALPMYMEALELLSQYPQHAWARGHRERMLLQAKKDFPHHDFLE